MLRSGYRSEKGAEPALEESRSHIVEDMVRPKTKRQLAYVLPIDTSPKHYRACSSMKPYIWGEPTMQQT